jgi:hypothetical protein
MTEWDAFISHASEDKATVARPLADKLAAGGISVWLDEAELRLGDSLREKIDAGLNKSQFGVVILSQNFFAKQWAKSELDGMIARESNGEKVVLPIWHKVTVFDVTRYSPILAGRFAVSTDIGLPLVAKRVIEAINDAGRTRTTGRPIYAGKLTKKMLLSVPTGSFLMTNDVNPIDLSPRFIEEIGDESTREELWIRLRDHGRASQKCYVFSNMANLRAHIAARHMWIKEPGAKPKDA